MKLFVILLAVGLGGAMGAVTRNLLGTLFHVVMGLPEYVAIMIVNIAGSFLIGFVFFCLEGLLKKDMESRLQKTPLARPLVDEGWWPSSDPTRPVVSDFKKDLRAELLAAFIITGILGGMTTFSLFSLLSLNLAQSGNHVAMLINAAGTVLLGWLAAYLGLICGSRLTLRLGRSL